jgi:hypothetical protein
MPNWLNKLLGQKEEKELQKKDGSPQKPVNREDPFAPVRHIRFGRYSDNNKTLKKTQCWYKAEDLYKEKKYNEAFAELFQYLRDDDEDNVHFYQNGDKFTFDLVQGSRKVYGECDGMTIVARVPLAVMNTPQTAIMRRLLDMNYALYYSRTAMSEDNTLYMVFDSEVHTASPNKMYYGLRELATKGDRQDDLLLADFDTLKLADQVHYKPLGQHELDIKYSYFRKWIEETLARVSELNQDSFSGAIAYVLLGVVYRIDFLITPESKLLSDLENVHSLYWEKKDEVPLVERNKMMKDAIKKLLLYTKEEFANNVYWSSGTFAISTPHKQEKVREYIVNANRDGQWYVENKYPDVARRITEYGILYSQFVYSMPKVLSDLTMIYMAVIHANYFEELGMTERLYDHEKNTFDEELIKSAIDRALDKFKDKYKEMHWDHDRVSYTNLFEFGTSFGELMSRLNLETRRT